MKKFLCIFLFFFTFCPFSLNAQEIVKPIKILIVPGHDNEFSGARYKNIKEASMNLVLGTQIYNFLKKDKRFEVYITRDQNGYLKNLQDYFSTEKEDILTFKNNAKKNIKIKISSGDFISKTTVPHVAVSSNVAIKLYGINKWANENNIDAVIHIHFNDYPRPIDSAIGKYKGFVVYMPDKQFPNALESDKLAKSIFIELAKKYSTSTYPKEAGGLIPDQKLIALGASETLNESVRSVLVEYGYIYQKIFRESSTRHEAYKNMADLTAKGIENYFFN